jgi:glycosyltransferase involved in cell wall biosynthesis
MPSGAEAATAMIVGAGGEAERLERYAHELGVADRVELRSFVPYDEMPRLMAEASCLVLGSLPTMHWEEQFGMVLVEAMAAGLPIVASTSGAISEVTGPGAAHVAPGDWIGLARALADGPLSSPPGTRAGYDAERVRQFGASAAAGRLAAAYDELLGERP